jgi:ATP-dependent DNA helicase RecQ
MIDLCESALCRRQSLLSYFGETIGRCGHCDLCRDEAKDYDATIDAQKVLSAVVRTGERFGAGYIADVLTGEATDAVRQRGHDQLKTFGVGKDKSKRAWQTVIRQLYAAGAIEEASAEHGGYRIAQRGVAILKGQERLTLRVVQETAKRQSRRERTAAMAELDAGGNALFEHLRALRLDIARKEGMAAYMVFADRTLIDMARLKPRNRDELKLVHGVGEAKLARYGGEFLGAIAGFSAP